MVSVKFHAGTRNDAYRAGVARGPMPHIMHNQSTRRFSMNMRRTMVTTTVLVAGCAMGWGCSHEYGEQRPPVTDLDKRDRGLQSKDVVQATDDMAAKLLADPNLNASHTRWTIVVDRVENKTVSAGQDYDIFIQRLKRNLARQGRGRV